MGEKRESEAREQGGSKREARERYSDNESEIERKSEREGETDRKERRCGGWCSYNAGEKDFRRVVSAGCNSF